MVASTGKGALEEGGVVPENDAPGSPNSSSPEDCEKFLAPRCVDRHAEHVARVAREQLADKVTPGEKCLFALLDDADQHYVDGFTVFLRSLVRHHPGLDVPFLVMHKAVRGEPLKDITKRRISLMYPRIFYVEPLREPSILTNPLTFPDGGTAELYMQSGDLSYQNAFYHRLQLFTYTACSVVVHFDASDMVVKRSFLPDLFEAATAPGFVGFAAVPNCQLEGTPAAKVHNASYFNPGLYVVAGPMLSTETYAGLVRTAIRPKRRSWYFPNQWYADQDVLNLYFEKKSFASLPHGFNFNKRWVESRECKHGGDERILHFTGAKPWTPITQRRRHKDRLEKIYEIEREWWRVFLEDKTVIAGVGTSLRAPLGLYVDMFKDVIRVGALPHFVATSTGLRTTTQILDRSVSLDVPTGGGAGLQAKPRSMLVMDSDEALERAAVIWASRRVEEKPIFVIGLDLLSYAGHEGEEIVGELLRAGKLEVLDPFGNNTISIGM